MRDRVYLFNIGKIGGIQDTYTKLRIDDIDVISLHSDMMEKYRLTLRRVTTKFFWRTRICDIIDDKRIIISNISDIVGYIHFLWHSWSSKRTSFNWLHWIGHVNYFYTTEAIKFKRCNIGIIPFYKLTGTIIWQTYISHLLRCDGV
ncbi:hypothetical protein ES703_47451 [subsurface metagenome]